jgi:hypothetical protein
MVRLLLGHYAPLLEQNDTSRYTVKRIPAAIENRNPTVDFEQLCSLVSG